MNLYCLPCNSNHRFTEGEVERLVYLGQAVALPDPLLDDEARAHFEKVCLRDALNYGTHDQEMYAEWVSGMVEARKENRITATVKGNVIP